MFKHWLFPWKADAAKLARAGDVALRKATHTRVIAVPHQDNLVRSLMLSVALHALLLAMQFGDSDSSLPWFGVSGMSRNVSAPSLKAILRSQVVGEKPVAEQVTAVIVSDGRRHVAKPLVREPPPPRLPPEAATASIAKLVTLPQETGEKGRAAGAVADVPKIDAPDKGSTVLSTDKPGEWSLPAAKSRLEDEAREEPAVVEKAGKAPPVLEQKMVENLARIEEEKAALAAVAREKELVLERQRAEELARLEAKKAEQIAATRAKEEALAKQAEAEALAHKRQAEKMAAEKALTEKLAAEKALAEKAIAEKAAAERIAAEKVAAEKVAAEKAAVERSLVTEQSRLKGTVLGSADGSKTAGSSALTGSELARRGLEQARSAPLALPGREPADLSQPRRGSILGRDPKDIQLAFYGDSWRLKVERIGSLNYPKLSKNLVYEPLVVTVSINSDGTLAAVRIDKSSGHRELDEAVRRILEMSAPFSAFPPDLKRSFDVIDITRTWTFLEERPRIVSQ